MPSKLLSNDQMTRAMQAIKAELDRQGVKHHVAHHHLSAGNAIDLHALIPVIASALVSWPERAPRQWALIERINMSCGGEGWALFVHDDGQVAIETDTESNIERLDAYSYVEERADRGSFYHQIARGMHGMMLTEEN